MTCTKIAVGNISNLSQEVLQFGVDTKPYLILFSTFVSKVISDNPLAPAKHVRPKLLACGIPTMIERMQ